MDILEYGDMAELIIHNLGQSSYSEALDVQMACVAQVQQDASDDVHLVLVEHVPAVITLGRRGGGKDILASAEVLADRGIETHVATRGGQVTYHGPGQLVGYVITHLGRRGKDVRSHVRKLEQSVIGTTDAFGLPTQRRAGQEYTGVWTADASPRKLAAIGVAVSRWVSYHGLAMNICTDLSAFDLIVPCGLAEPVTSLAVETETHPTVESVLPAFIDVFRDVYCI
jgi:lipoyl(octanoyl) transferase